MNLDFVLKIFLYLIIGIFILNMILVTGWVISVLSNKSPPPSPTKSATQQGEGA